MNQVSQRQLQVFVQLAASGSFAEAANRLHLSQPALSIAMRKFEEQVGGVLINRSKRMVELTPEGAAFLPVARRLLHDWEDAFSDLHNVFAMRRGKLTLAAMPSFANSLLPTVLADFHRDYPDINIAVQDVVMERVIEAVQLGRCEIGISFQPERDESLDFTPLFNDHFEVIMTPEHPLCGHKAIQWACLANHRYIAMNRGSALRGWCDRALADAGVTAAPVAEASQLSTVGELVASGLGVAVVPALCRKEMTRRGLRCIRLDDTASVRQVGVLTKPRAALSVAAQSLFASLKAYPWHLE